MFGVEMEAREAGGLRKGWDVFTGCFQTVLLDNYKLMSDLAPIVCHITFLSILRACNDRGMLSRFKKKER